jgi:hypothetical protein
MAMGVIPEGSGWSATNCVGYQRKYSAYAHPPRAALARDGALQAATTPQATNAAELAHTLTDLFTRYVGDDLAGVNTNPGAESTA